MRGKLYLAKIGRSRPRVKQSGVLWPDCYALQVAARGCGCSLMYENSLMRAQIGDLVDLGTGIVTYERSAQPAQSWQVVNPSKVGWCPVAEFLYIPGGGARWQLPKSHV